MSNVRRVFIVLIGLIISTSIWSQEVSKVDVDKVFKTANLLPLIFSKKPLNLIAQTQNADVSTDNIGDLTDFVAFGYVPLSDKIASTEFDQNQKILHRKSEEGSWTGAAEFLQAEIPSVSLQQGLERVQICMSNKNQALPFNKITKVIIYKTVNTEEIIYDYYFKDPKLPAKVCREVLYMPKTDTCQYGMVAGCHFDM